MAEESAERAPQFKRETGRAANLAAELGVSEEKVYALGNLAKAEIDLAKSEGKESPLSAFLKALASAWVKLDLGPLGSPGVKPEPLRKWSDKALRNEYQLWSAFQPEESNSEFASVHKQMLDNLESVAKERGHGVWAFVKLGMEIAPDTAAKTEDFGTGRIQIEAVKDFAHRTLLQLHDTTNPLTRADWESIRQRCLMLQRQHNLEATYDKGRRQDTASLFILKLLEHVERELPKATSVRRHMEQSQRERPMVLDIKAEVQGILAGLGDGTEPRPQGRDRSTRSPQAHGGRGMSRTDEERFLADQLKNGRSPDEARAMLQSARRQIRHYGTPEALGSSSARTEAVSERSTGRGEDYYKVKNRIMSQADWSTYGWSQEEKSEIRQLLEQFSERQALNIMAAILLQGETGAACKTKILQSRDAQGRVSIMSYLGDLEIPINDNQVMQILIPSDVERRRYLDGNYFQPEPRTIEELAWQIAFETPALFGENGPYPVLERKVKEKRRADGTIEYVFREWVNEANVVQWMRYIQFQAHSNHTMKPMDFAQEVGLRKQWKMTNVYEMLDHKAAMGHSKYGGDDYKQLIEYLEVETGLYGGPRANYLQVWHNKGDREQVQKVRTEQFYENFFTRPFGGKSMFTWMHQMAENYEIGDKPSDGKMGAAINTIFWTYANIANPGEMARVLGLGNNPEDLGKLFNLENLIKARKELCGSEDPNTWLDLSKNGAINGVKIKDVFDVNTGEAMLGTWEQQYNFMKMWNFYAYTNPSENGKTLFRTMIQDRAAEMHGIATSINGVEVSWNKKLAENIAFYNTWFFGVSATNDVLDAAHQWETKTTGRYRYKTIGGRASGKKNGKDVLDPGRAGEFGNPWTVNIFKRWLISPFHGIRTTTPDEKLKGNFKAISQVMGEAQQTRFALDQRIAAEVDNSLRTGALNSQIQQKIQEITRDQDRKVMNGDLEIGKVKNAGEIQALAVQEIRVKEWNRVLHEIEGERGLREYKAKTEEFVFTEDSMYKYIKDHYDKGVNLDKRLRGAEELKFDKYIKYTPFVGATFDQESWQKDMAKLVTDVRYCFQNYGELNYNMEIWDWDPKLQITRKMTLGESMFSEQLVNIPEFMTKGKVDWNKVNKNQKVLYKRWLESFITGQLLQYRELRSWGTNPRYSFTMTEDILEAIGKIPSIVEYDEGEMRKTRVKEFFFTKQQMRRIRKESGTTKFKMYFIESINSGLFSRGGKSEGLLSGLADALGIIAKESFTLAA